ncbi:MAG: hypothetical protein ACKON7_03815 [Planctomycetaceae bacterium]
MTTQPHARAAIRLTLGVVVMTAVWCGLLPRLLEWRPIARHVTRMEARRVDPAAMYYTELERLPLRPSWIETALILWP